MPLPLAIPLVMAGLGAAGHITNYFGARSAEERARRQLADLGKQPLPQYGVDPSIRRFYQQQTNLANSPKGFTGAETNAFRQNLSRALAAQTAGARSMSGGNLSKAINLMNVANQVGSINQFAAQDASLARQQQNQAFGRQFSAANVMQNVGNMNTQALMNRRLMQEQALGGAVRQQQDYQRGAIGGLSSDLLGAGTTLMGNADLGGTKRPRFRAYKKEINPNADPSVWLNI